jgi:hypothetical protein
MTDRICVSYSGMSMYENCPSAFRRRYIDKEETLTGDGPPSPAMMRGTRVHRGCEMFLLGHMEDIPEEAESFRGLFYALRDERKARPEFRWAFDDNWELVSFDDKENGKVRGVLDIDYIHDDTAHIFEIKTGKIYEDHAKQRNLYGLAGLLMYPEAHTVRVTNLYLDGAITKETVLMRGQLDTWKYHWDRKINGCQPPQVYAAKPNWKCQFCPYSKHLGGLCTDSRGKKK